MKDVNNDMELAVLGSMIRDRSIIPNVQAAISEADFFEPINREIFRAILKLNFEQKPVNQVSLFSEVNKNPALIAQLTDIVPSGAQWSYYCDKVKVLAMSRQFSALLADCKDISAENIENRIGAFIQGAAEIADHAGGETIKSARDFILPVITGIENAVKNRGKFSGIDTGLQNINDIVDGLQSEYIIIAARASIGKAQPLYAKIKTASGWKRMGDIAIGDKLASVDGMYSEVTGVFPQGEKDVYEITFSDGRKARATDEHLWTVNNVAWGDEHKTITTADIAQYLKSKRHQRRIFVPLVSGNFGHNEDLPLDPWLLGLYLGDGWCKGSCVMFSNNDKENIDRVRSIIGPENILHKGGKYDYRIRREKRNNQTTDIFKAIDSLGLSSVDSFTKFIPDVYKTACRSIRVSLLSGLISSDGNVEKSSTISYSSSSERLIDDIIELSRSLGCIATKRSRHTFFTYKGEKKGGAKSYRTNILMTNELKKEVLFLERHRERVREGRTRKNLLTILSIEHVGKEQAQCIMVSHPSHLYITDDYVVTHNTALAMNMAKNLVAQKIPVGYFSLEMSSKALLTRVLSDMATVEAKALRNGFMNEKNIQRVCNMGYDLAEYPLYPIDNTRGRFESIIAKSRYMVRCMGVKAIFIDHASLMKYPDRKLQRYEQFSEMSNALQNLQRELNVPLVLLAQLGREAEGKKPTLADLRESGTFEQDADQIWLMHRDRAKNADETMIETEVNIAKNRNGPCGSATLMFFPQFVRFKDKAYVSENR